MALTLGFSHILLAIILLPSAMFLGIVAIPLVFVYFWLLALGIWLLRPTARLRGLLHRTHLFVIPLALLLIAYGGFALHAGAESAERGGGLLSTFGLIPIAMGVFAGIVSALTLWFCRTDALEKAI